MSTEDEMNLAGHRHILIFPIIVNVLDILPFNRLANKGSNNDLTTNIFA